MPPCCVYNVLDFLKVTSIQLLAILLINFLSILFND